MPTTTFQDHALLTVGLHHNAREPAENAADNEPNNQIHGVLLLWSRIKSELPSGPLER
jgi:hypothetical protein